MDEQQTIPIGAQVHHFSGRWTGTVTDFDPAWEHPYRVAWANGTEEDCSAAELVVLAAPEMVLHG
jgi:hypothetical protein